MRPDSDLDLMIEFKRPVGLFAMVEMEEVMKNPLPRGSESRPRNKELAEQILPR